MGAGLVVLLGCATRHPAPAQVAIPDRERYHAMVAAYEAGGGDVAVPLVGFDLHHPAGVEALLADAQRSRRWRSAVADLKVAAISGSWPAAVRLAGMGRLDPLAALAGVALVGRRGETCDGGLALLQAEALAAVHRYPEAQAVLVDGCDPPIFDLGYERARLWNPADPAGALAAWGPGSGERVVRAVALKIRLDPAAPPEALAVALARWPGDYDLLAAAIGWAAARGDVAQALDWCDQLPGLTVEARGRQRARVLANAGRLEEAIAELGATEEESWELRLELVGRAGGSVRRAWAAAPAELRGAKLWARYGEELARIGADPREALINALDRDPGRATAAVRLVRWVVDEGGDRADARARALTALEATPGSGELLVELGRLDAQRGAPAAALTWWGEARERGATVDPAAWEAALAAAGWRTPGGAKLPTQGDGG